MAVHFHGMNFHFNRDEAPSHWSAHREDGYSYDGIANMDGDQSAAPSIPEIAYYGVPLLLVAVSVFVIMCAVGTCCGCVMAHYRARMMEQSDPMLNYKAVPLDEEA